MKDQIQQLIKSIHVNAETYAEMENSAYTNDYNGFCQGALWMCSEFIKLLNIDMILQASVATEDESSTKVD